MFIATAQTALREKLKRLASVITRARIMLDVTCAGLHGAYNTICMGYEIVQ